MRVILWKLVLWLLLINAGGALVAAAYWGLDRLLYGDDDETLVTGKE